jgi:membrane protease subunit HflK
MAPLKNPPIEIVIPRINPRWIQVIALLILLIWAAFSSFYTVPTDSVGVIQRFGKFIDTSQPGLHFKMPFGVDRVTLVPVRRQQKLEFGFSTQGYTNPYQPSREPERETSMVTGDLNSALVEWVVQYRIDDPRQWLFHVRDPEDTLRDQSESVMREIVGDRTVDEVITIGRQDIESQAMVKLRDLAKAYELGAVIDQIQLKNVHPPREVQQSFNEVNRAQQERENLINVANGEYNKVIPRARGEADQKIQGAEGYKFKRVNEAEGDVAAFNAVLAEYLKAPDITRARLYLETMAEVLPQAGPKIIIDDSVKQIFPVLPGLVPAATQTGIRR